MSQTTTLKAELRSNFGTGASRVLRKQNKVPAIVYGNNKEPLAITINLKDITILYHQGLIKSRVLNLDIMGQQHAVLCKHIDLHQIKDTISHVDFVNLNDEQQIIQMPIVFDGIERSPGVKRGGYFNMVHRAIKVQCPVSDIPRSVNIDVSEVSIGKIIKAKDLVIPNGCKLLVDPELVIASVIGKGGKEEPAAASAAK